ncbi:capsular biosynthesis protein [Actibacterium sp. XHP0104]|uniref:capsular polysaccharide export protein, LipB/KpsS family n=1 Tax=Actibacterium sp. XHP0104 TaxID=2984335 RepID=UPI0021E930E5|nr:capsular biosynthesis protein [Actibacterium sp. XHP0104]MCV2881688.1 capsular biosynthesis protein [Actibacterium sp. XHP0104]
MIAYLAGYSRKKDSVFESVARADGGGVRLPLIGLSPRDFPESRARAQAALAVAKKQPGSALGRAAKFHLIRMQYNWSRRYFARHPDRVAMCWNGITGSRRAFMEGARDAGAARLYAELAPFPGRITLDHTGVNALNSVPRDAGWFAEWAGDDDARNGEGWRALGANLTARTSRRADVGQGDAGALADAGKFLFVPLQVPNDSQITLFAGWVQSVPGMLAALANAARHLPDGWHIRVKEHPSAKTSLAEPLARAVADAGGRIIIDNQTDTFAQVAASGGVITINSSVGLQAFFHDRPVIVLGQAFFAQSGLVTVADSARALQDALHAPESLSFDPQFRARFMNFLDGEYYPPAESGENDALSVDPVAIAHKLALARAAI